MTWKEDYYRYKFKCQCKKTLTMVSAAFVGRSVGLGFCTRGAGGGGAAVCGAAASLDKPCGPVDKGRGDAFGTGSG